MKTSSSWWSLVKWGILAVALTGLGLYILSHRDDFRIISNINPAILILVVLANVISQMVGALRSLAVMRFLGLTMPVIEWLRVFIFARILSLSVPQSGNVYRATVLKMRHGFLVRDYVAAYSAYIILAFISMVCFTILVVLVANRGLTVFGYPVAALLVLFVAFFIAAFYALGRLSTSAKGIVQRWGRWPAAINAAFGAMITCLKNVRLVASIAIWGILTFSLGAAANWLCFADLGSFPGIARIVVYNLVSSVSYLVYLTPGNFGIREVAYGAIGSGMEELAATGIIVALILRVTGFVSLMLLGAVFGVLDLKKRSRTPSE